MKGGRSEANSKEDDNRLAVKKQSKKEKKAAKDPNKPKRPPSAFFVFMEDFRKQYKEKHPNNKSVAVVGKAGGGKWKSMSDEEKAPFIAKAELRKEEYECKMKSYNRKLEGGSGDDESDESKSELNDGEDEGSEEEEEDDDYIMLETMRFSEKDVEVLHCVYLFVLTFLVVMNKCASPSPPCLVA